MDKQADSMLGGEDIASESFTCTSVSREPRC